MNKEYMNIIYNICQILAVICFVSSIQFKKKKSILLMQRNANVFYAITYFLTSYIGLPSANAAGFTEINEFVKNIVFYNYEKKGKKIPIFYLYLFLVILFIIAFFNYNGLISLFPLIINVIYFVSSYMKNPYYIRLSVTLCGFLWIIFNFSVGAKIVIIGNLFEVISGFVSLYRFKTKGKKKYAH